MNIGKGIKFVRVAAGLRQNLMAERLGISQNYLSLLENNKAEPSISLLKKISREFDVPVGFLLWEELASEGSGNPDTAERYSKLREAIHELQRLRISSRQDERLVAEGT